MQSKKYPKKINNHLSVKYNEGQKKYLLFVGLFTRLRKRLEYMIRNNN